MGGSALDRARVDGLKDDLGLVLPLREGPRAAGVLLDEEGVARDLVRVRVRVRVTVRVTVSVRVRVRPGLGFGFGFGPRLGSTCEQYRQPMHSTSSTYLCGSSSGLISMHCTVPSLAGADGSRHDTATQQ